MTAVWKNENLRIESEKGLQLFWVDFSLCYQRLAMKIQHKVFETTNKKAVIPQTFIDKLSENFTHRTLLLYYRVGLQVSCEKNMTERRLPPSAWERNTECCNNEHLTVVYFDDWVERFTVAP